MKSNKVKYKAKRYVIGNLYVDISGSRKIHKNVPYIIKPKYQLIKRYIEEDYDD